MSRFTASSDVDRFPENPQEAFKYTTLALEQIGQLLNNGLSLSDNFDAKILTITFTAANTDLATVHGLGRVPTSYIQIGQTAAMSIYDGASANTSSLIYLRSDAAGTVRLVVF